MQCLKSNDNFFIRLDKGEMLIPSLERLAKEHQWASGHVSGIGALEDITLGYFQTHTKSYRQKAYPDFSELLCLEGNLSWHDDSPIFHLHAQLANAQFECFGGHLFSALVALTCEINFRPFSQKINRQFDEGLGFLQIQLD